MWVDTSGAGTPRRLPDFISTPDFKVFGTCPLGPPAPARYARNDEKEPWLQKACPR